MTDQSKGRWIPDAWIFYSREQWEEFKKRMGFKRWEGQQPADFPVVLTFKKDLEGSRWVGVVEILGHMTDSPHPRAPLARWNRVFDSEKAATKMVKTLIEMSQWFELTPLPDDCWKITVKAEELPIDLLRGA